LRHKSAALELADNMTATKSWEDARPFKVGRFTNKKLQVS
jgi:hypothetical protein